ncbi:hypothetical protein CRH09_16360 [Nocardia terpenica]|uniref:Uncharacterized protein n=2 Tax=Nocardia terpenica TaxID=455432 RepID=A0A291RJT0_9NOCA|nr:hypothetical protein CRH09_16360 [Nocardia terpenica]
MGDMDDEDDGPATFQQAWLADLAFYDRFFPDRAAALRAQGPPPPMKADGYWGRYAYCKHHAATDPVAAAEFGKLKVERSPEG